MTTRKIGEELIRRPEEAVEGWTTEIGEPGTLSPTVGWLLVLSGPLKGRDFRLSPGGNMIGSDARCAVVLTDHQISPNEANIQYEADAFVLTDRSGLGRIRVNGKIGHAFELVDNDRITIARTNLVFKSPFA